MSRIARIYLPLIVLGLMFTAFVWHETEERECKRAGNELTMKTWWWDCE